MLVSLDHQLNVGNYDPSDLASCPSMKYAGQVGGNWRVTFKFVGTDAEIAVYEDYH